MDLFCTMRCRQEPSPLNPTKRSLWYVLSSPSPCPHGGALSLHLLQDTTSLPLKKKRTASLLQWPKDLLRTLKKVKYYTYHSFAHNISIFMNILCTNIYLAYPLLWKIKSEITTWWKGRIRMYGLSNPRSERTSWSVKIVIQRGHSRFFCECSIEDTLFIVHSIACSVSCSLELSPQAGHPSLAYGCINCRATVHPQHAPLPRSPAVSYSYADVPCGFQVPELPGTHGRLRWPCPPLPP